MGAIDLIALEVEKILHLHPKAKYIILSRPAFMHLRARNEANRDFWFDDKKITFRGRQVAIVETGEIIIDVGGIK